MHKHAKVIKAWAEGAYIEYKYPSQTYWRPCDQRDPRWLDNVEYRVKPRIIRTRVRLGLFKDNRVFVAHTHSEANYFQGHVDFIRWLGELTYTNKSSDFLSDLLAETDYECN